MSVILCVIVILFLLRTYQNNKPIKWNDLLNILTFNFGARNDDTFRIPGPARLPFLGTKWNSIFVKMNKLHEHYAEMNRKYGDVVMEMMGSVPIISLYNKQDIDKVLRFPSKYPFRPPTEIIAFYRESRPDRYNSVGMVNAQGPQWAHLRTNLSPKTIESRKVLADFCPDLNQICDDFINLLKERRDEDNSIESFEDIVKLLAFEGACCMIFGQRMGYLNESSDNNKLFREKIILAAKNVFKSIRDAYYSELNI